MTEHHTKTPGKPRPDAVNHPSHYTSGGIECIDAMHAAAGTEHFVAHCALTALKYAWRYRLKGNPAQDLRKGAWYLTRAAEALEAAHDERETHGDEVRGIVTFSGTTLAPKERECVNCGLRAMPRDIVDACPVGPDGSVHEWMAAHRTPPPDDDGYRSAWALGQIAFGKQVTAHCNPWAHAPGQRAKRLADAWHEGWCAARDEQGRSHA